MPNDLEVTLTTARLDLTPLVPSDASEMFAILSDPVLGSFTGDEPPSSIESLEGTYRVLAGRRDPDGDDRWFNWVVRRSGDVIGYVQATVAATAADLAWVIGVDHQRQGYATEAAGAMVRWLRDDLDVITFHASIRDDHVASRGVARALGLSPTESFDDGERVWRLDL